MKMYEQAARTTLTRRVPLILRVDGKAFHTWTRGMDRPFDMKLIEAMDRVTLALCEECEGAVLAYTQSDEISLLLHNYKRLQSQPWFDNQVQKMVSVAASVAGATLTKESFRIWAPIETLVAPGDVKIRTAFFDARAFILPEAEVANYFLWRQQDASRNSIQMLARSLYSHKELNGKNTSELNELCHAKGVNWNDLPTRLRRGRCAVKVYEEKDGVTRGQWAIDNEIPIFSQQREYIEQHLATLTEDPIPPVLQPILPAPEAK